MQKPEPTPDVEILEIVDNRDKVPSNASARAGKTHRSIQKNKYMYTAQVA